MSENEINIEIPTKTSENDLDAPMTESENLPKSANSPNSANLLESAKSPNLSNPSDMTDSINPSYSVTSTNFTNMADSTDTLQPAAETAEASTNTEMWHSAEYMTDTEYTDNGSEYSNDSTIYSAANSQMAKVSSDTDYYSGYTNNGEYSSASAVAINRKGNKFNRQPPFNIEAEQAVLGSMMLNRDSIEVVMGILLTDDFYREAHRHIYHAIILMNRSDIAVDMVTLTEYLSQHNQLDKVGGIATLAFLNNAVPSVSNVKHYANIVREKAVLRNLINISSEIANSAYDDSEDLKDILDTAEKKIMAVTTRQDTGTIVPISNLVLESLKRLEDLYTNKGKLLGISSGFTDLDTMLSGLQKSDMILVAARPSMGKTAFTLNIAANVAIRSKLPVAFFSLEMSGSQLMTRMLSSESHISGQKAKVGDIKSEDWVHIMEASDTLYNAPLYIDDTAGITITELRSKARRIKAEHGMSLMIIDYLQLMQGSSSKSNSDNRQQEVSEISRSLKALARELDVPVIALSQLSRGVESRQVKRPMLSDLRESGSLEQDADIVMFLYREDYYNQETENKNITDVIVAKHRNGPIGDIKLYFDKETTTFRNLSKME